MKKDGKQRDTEVSYLITNLPPELAAAETLLALSRGYWGAVENGIHYVRGVALGEDACRVRSNALPRVMAACANLAISMLRLLQVKNIKRTMNQLLYQGGATSVMALSAGRERPARRTGGGVRPAPRRPVSRHPAWRAQALPCAAKPEFDLMSDCGSPYHPAQSTCQF